MTLRYWFSCDDFTVQVNTDEDGKIVFAAPVISKFRGQPLENLLRWKPKHELRIMDGASRVWVCGNADDALINEKLIAVNKRIGEISEILMHVDDYPEAAFKWAVDKSIPVSLCPEKNLAGEADYLVAFHDTGWKVQVDEAVAAMKQLGKKGIVIRVADK